MKRFNPDCGYGWVVVAGCFVINFIMAGLARSAGVLYKALIDVYGVSREVATAPFSLRFCVRNLSGPIVGALGQRFGIRPIVILGGLVGGLGGIVSALAPDVTWIAVAWGGIHGLGYGLSNIIHAIVINRYFYKYRGLALGISYTGDCFGTFLLPLLLEMLLPIYDLKGTFLILAGISLNVVPAAMLLRSPDWEENICETSADAEVGKKALDGVTLKEGLENKGFDTQNEEYDTQIQQSIIKYTIPVITLNADISQASFQSNQNSVIKDNNEGAKAPQMQFEELSINSNNKYTFLNDSLNLNDIYCLRQSSSLRVKDKVNQEKRLSCNFTTLRTNSLSERESPQTPLNSPTDIRKCLVNAQFKETVKQHYLNPNSVHAQSVSNKTNEANQSVENSKDCSHIYEETTRNRRNSFYETTISQSQLVLPTIDAPLCEEKILLQLNNGQYLNAESHEHINDSNDKDTVKQRSSFKSFVATNLKPLFLIISVTMALYVFLFISIFTIIIDYASDNNIPNEYGTYLIIAFSVTDAFGRIGFGIVLDKKWIPLSHYAGITVGLMAIFIIIIPLYKCYTFWIISFSLCGFIQGGVAIMYPVLVEHYMDKDEVSVAMGCMNFYGGVLMFPIPRMIGYFRDNVGSYDGVFWTVGGLCIFAASLWLLEPLIVSRQTKATNKSTASDNADPVEIHSA